MTVLQLDEFKARQRDTWGAGDYSACSPYIAEVGELVVTRAGINPGMKVLDVACGTGNAALPAARAGARVTGLDLTPKLLDAGRAKAKAEGLTIEWREGDAENLPFEDGSFDRILSTFGHMFAPRHQQTAAEMVRVCRRGGAIVTATWTPEGVFGDIFKAAASYMPPPPDYASPPPVWGREDYVRELFSDVATGFTTQFPMMVAAQRMLGERFGEMRQRIVDIWTRRNEATDGSLRLPQEYLLSVVRL
jgi:SAM-dependent methyltransferase